MYPKIGEISFNEKVISEFYVNHVVFHKNNKDSYVENVTKDWCDFFQRESYQRVFNESLSFM